MMNKKTLAKSLSLLLSLLMLCSALAGCMAARVDNSVSKDSKDSDNVSQAVFTSETEGALDLSQYCLVRPDSADRGLVYAASVLRAHIEQYTGVNIELKSDAETPNGNEILIGNTNRNASSSIYSATKGENWAVKQVGTNIVLAAGELCDIVNATNWFVENCLQKNNNYMVVGDGYATNNTLNYNVSGFTIGSYSISDLKVTYLASDNVGYIDAAVLLADNIRRMSGITPTVTTYDPNASGQILVASEANGGSYSTVTANAMQYAITKRNNNIVIVANDEMGAEMGTQKIITAMINAGGAELDLSTLVKSSAYTYTYGNNLNLEYGAEYRIMSYNVERVDSTLDGNTSDRYDEALGNVLFYNPDVVGFQEFCVNYTANLKPSLENNGYTFVNPKPVYYSENDNTCATRYSMENNYTPIAYKTAKFELLDSGSKRIIPCRPNSSNYTNTIQPSYGWPGYTVTWAVLKDKSTGEVFAVTSLHNLTNQTIKNAEAKVESLKIVKALVDQIVTDHSCPVFMVGDYNSYDNMPDYKSLVNDSTEIYDARYIAERGYASCSSHHSRSTTVPTSLGFASSTIDHILVTGSARILRHRFATTAQVFAASDHKPTFIDVVIGEKISVPECLGVIFDEANSSMHINPYIAVENVAKHSLSNQKVLAITEVATHATAGYDFVEVMNVSDKPVDLYDYYIHRETRSFKNYARSLAQSILLQAAMPTASVKHRLSSTENNSIAPGEVAIIWLTSNSYSEDNFKTQWDISGSDAKISKVQIDTTHTITAMYGSSGTIKNHDGVGDYLSRSGNVAYSLTIAHEDLSNGLIDYELFTDSTATLFDTEDNLMLRQNASSLVAIAWAYGTTLSGNQSAVFNAYHTAETLQTAIEGMTTVANKNCFAACFVGPIESADTSEACLGLYNTNNTSATSTITPLPYFEFTADVTPGTASGQNFINKNGKLAITEIMPAPAESEYEYIEIKNTGEGIVYLSDYYLYRFGFSNNSPYNSMATGIRQVFGLYGTNSKLVKVSLSDIEGAKTVLAPGETAVIWIQSFASNGKTVSDFEQNWDLTSGSVNVLTLKVHDGTKDLYPVGTGSDSSSVGYIRNDAGNGFLADTKAGMVLSFIHKDKTIEGVTPANDDIENNRTTTYTKARHAAADCSALLLVCDKVENKAANYYGYVDLDKFNNAAEAITPSGNVTAIYTIDTTEGLIPSSLLVDKRIEEDKENLKLVANKTANSNGNIYGIPFVNVAIADTATPGQLLEGQFGYTSAVVVEGVQTRTNGDNTADLRFVASLKGSYLDYLGAGFEFTFEGKTAKVTCKHVYRTLNSTQGVISVEDYDADYFLCYTLKNLSAGTYTIDIRSWTVEDGSAAEIYSESKAVTFTVASNGSISFN
jgi:endonuclease/exonuclease/phosphatase family metal-dependent hydrolase